MNFNKDLNLKNLYCYHPFNTITIDGDGDVYPCICQAWLPISVGKIWEFDTLEDCVRNPISREIQASILDGTYKYCDEKTCGLLQNTDEFLKPTIDHRIDGVNWINFCIDPSCNLTCPSCRKDFTFINSGEKFETRMKIVDHVVKLIKNYDDWIKFSVSNDGDPFASLIYRDLLSKLEFKSSNKSEIEIVTNGILLKSHWHKLEKIHKNIIRTKISFDAATEDTYNLTRRGGDWKKLIESSKFLVDWKEQNNSNMSITANFVVQTTNYKEMNDYINICEDLKFDEIHFQKVVDWGTWRNFSEHCVWDKNHPEFSTFCGVLEKIKKTDKVILNNLETLYNYVRQN